MYERINVRGILFGVIVIVLSLAIVLNNGGILSIFKNPLFYAGAAVVAYNAIEPRIKHRRRYKQH